AWISHDIGSSAAGIAGNLREDFTEAQRNARLRMDSPLDSFRDLYNNEVGRRIGDYARANGLERDAIEGLILDAFRNGHFVTSIEDPRIDPAFDGTSRDFSVDIRWSVPSRP